jgi:arylsulfatase
MPCRYSWITGLYGSQTERGAGAGYDWPDYHRTMPQALQAAGYHTSLIGKLHARTTRTLKQHHLSDLESHTKLWGFDDVFECSGRAIWSYPAKNSETVAGHGIKGCRYTDYLRLRGLYEKALQENIERDLSERNCQGLEPYRPGVLEAADTMDAFVLREMCRFVRDYQSVKPWFLHASFFAPHYPMDVPADIFTRFRPEDMPPPVGISDPELIQRWQENRAMYMGLVSLLDEFIGALLSEVESRGMLVNTIVLFTTDHGDMLGDLGMHHKYSPYEGSCRTPMMVRLPSLSGAGTLSAALAESADLPHTILEMAGFDDKQRSVALPDSPGVSQWPVVSGLAQEIRRSAYAETQRNARMLRMDRWKYIRTPGRDDLLFDLKKDPYEEVNLAHEPAFASELQALDTELFQRMATLRVPPLQGKDHGCRVMSQSVRGGIFA